MYIINFKTARIIASIFLLLAGMMFTGTISAPTLPAEILQKKWKQVITVDAKQIACMAKNIFYEARGESILGQAAVAQVVMNRVRYGFEKNPCAVVYQATTVKRDTDDGVEYVKICQFSWVCESKPELNKNNARYKQAERIAYEILANNKYADILPKNTLFFHNASIDPGWSYRKVATIGNHVFYSREKRKE